MAMMATCTSGAGRPAEDSRSVATSRNSVVQLHFYTCGVQVSRGSR